MKHLFKKNLSLQAPELRRVTEKVALVDGINLSQGTCELPTPEIAREGAIEAIRRGENRYSPADGIPRLRKALTAKLLKFNDLPEANAKSVITTSGSTGAFEAVSATFIDPGDCVATFAPFYPYHIDTLERAGARIDLIQLKQPNWSIDFKEAERQITSETKFLLLCNPSNPTGKVFSQEELSRLAQICLDRDVAVITDEVYEYITYDGTKHISMASLPKMGERTITMGSYSKTFAMTGWRIGFVAPPQDVRAAIRASFDKKNVCAPTPLQHGVAAGIEGLGDEYYEEFREDLARKRNILCEALSAAAFTFSIPPGAYYVLANFAERFPNQSSEEVVDQMIDTIGVGAVPASDFLGRHVRGDAKKSNVLRFCFALPDERLIRACERIRKL